MCWVYEPCCPLRSLTMQLYCERPKRKVSEAFLRSLPFWLHWIQAPHTIHRFATHSNWFFTDHPAIQVWEISDKNGFFVGFSLEKANIDITRNEKLSSVFKDLPGYDPIHTKKLNILVEKLMTKKPLPKVIEVINSGFKKPIHSD